MKWGSISITWHKTLNWKSHLWWNCVDRQKFFTNNYCSMNTSLYSGFTVDITCVVCQEPLRTA